MKLKLSDWANIAELVGAVAIVVSLLFVGLEIRNNAQQTEQNTAVTRAAMFDSILKGLADFRENVINDSEVAELFETFYEFGYDSLEGTNQLRSRQLAYLALENQQRAYFLHEYGVIGEPEWARFPRQICILYERVVASDSLSESMQFVLADEFWEYMTTSCVAQ